MSDKLKPGEYVGANGRRYQWSLDSASREFVWHGGESGPISAYAHISTPDLRAAAEALVALADELETEYVELVHESSDRQGVRLGLRGSEVWVECKGRETGGVWVRRRDALSGYVETSIVAAYRAGLARGEGEE